VDDSWVLFGDGGGEGEAMRDGGRISAKDLGGGDDVVSTPAGRFRVVSQPGLPQTTSLSFGVIGTGVRTPPNSALGSPWYIQPELVSRKEYRCDWES